jgi:hypothetical protein
MSSFPTARTADLLPFILPKAKAAPQPFAELQARVACIEFCENTRCWRHITTVMLETQGQAVVAPFYATIHEFEEATLDGVPLTPTQFIDVKPETLTGRAEPGNAAYIAQSNPGTVTVYPQQTGTLRLSVFLKPRYGQLFGMDAENPLEDAYNVIPEFLVAQHAQVLAAGALSRILSTPDEPFTDMKMAAVYRQEFELGMSRHFSSNIRGQQRAPVRTRPQWM